MQWKLPPSIKIMEALGAIADGRIKRKGNRAKVISSTRRKTYHVMFNPKIQAITSNDNGSYWQGYLGYPAIAFLISKGRLKYQKETVSMYKGFAWKEINTRFKNDFKKTEKYCQKEIAKKYGIPTAEIDQEIKNILRQLKKLKFKKLPSNLQPPPE